MGYQRANPQPHSASDFPCHFSLFVLLSFPPVSFCLSPRAAKSSIGISAMGVIKPDLIMRGIIPVVMAVRPRFTFGLFYFFSSSAVGVCFLVLWCSPMFARCFVVYGW